MKHTPATESVLAVFLEHPLEEHYGWELMERTGIPSGTLYPILDRLSRKGWLESHWDTSQKPRKQYRITARGIHDASEYLSLETSFRRGSPLTVDAAKVTASQVRSEDDDERE
jgi:DNA-binding PadR family transcriptional regulator